MSESIVARRYARALLEVARERDEIQVVADRLNRIAKAVLQDSTVAAFLANPQASKDEKAQALLAGLEAIESPDTLKAFLSVLCAASRAALLPTVAREFAKLADDVTGVVEASVISPAPLDEATTGRVRARLEGATGRKVRLETEIRPDLLGGVKVRIGNTVLDGSLQSRIEQMRRALK